MNAPLPEHLRCALETVTLDDKPLCGLLHTYAAGGAAACRGYGVEQSVEGAVQ